MTKQFVRVDKTTLNVVAYFIQDSAPEDSELFEYHGIDPQMAQFPPTPPSASHSLRLVGDFIRWVETATVSQLKERKRVEITTARLVADADHFDYTYSYLDANGATVTETKSIRTADKDMFDLLTTGTFISLFGKFPAKWPGGWKAVDDTYVRISTVEEFKTFFETMYNTGINNFMWSQELKARLEVAATVEQIAAINW